MAQVSRRPLDKDIEGRIYESFYKAVGLLNEKEARAFINDLLTPTEKIMLPKRLAIAILLSRGWNYDAIRDTLKVTQTTVSSVYKVLSFSTGLRLAIEKLSANQAWQEWWQGIEKLLYRLSSPGKVFMEEGVIKHKLGHKRKTLI